MTKTAEVCNWSQLTGKAEREWVDLTDDEIATVVHEMNGNEPTSPFWRDLIYEAIADFKEKNK
jgi:hypothetical protein